MTSHTKRQEYFSSFQRGEKTVFLIISKHADEDFLKIRDIIFRKLDDRRVSILGWIDKAEAQRYLETQIQGDEFKIFEMTGDTFRKFLNTFSDEKRRLILLELI